MSDKRDHQHSPSPLMIAAIGILLLGVAVGAAQGIVHGALFTGLILIGLSLILVWNDDLDVFYWSPRRKVAGLIGLVTIIASIGLLAYKWLLL